MDDVIPGLGKIIPAKDAIQAFLDRDISPVIAIDTEYDGSKPVYRTDLHGVGIAGGYPQRGLVGAFFPFRRGEAVVPWDYLFNKVLLPIFGDPYRVVVMHPIKTDIQIFRARGLREEHVKCDLECTMSMLHVHDENLPKGLKDSATALLGVQEAASYKNTQKEMAALLKEGAKVTKAIMQQCWIAYKAERKTSKEEICKIDPTWPSWKRMVMSLPPKQLKKHVEELLLPRIKSVVMRDYQNRANSIFYKYGALDALMTLALRYFFMDGIPGIVSGFTDEDKKLLELETSICHPIVTEMEEAGMLIDIKGLEAIKGAINNLISDAEAKIQETWGSAVDEGQTFNPSSTDQVARILWQVWGVRPPPWALSDGEVKEKFLRKKDGLCSTDDEVLQYISKNKRYGKAVQHLLAHRRLVKLQGTYVEPFLQYALDDPEYRIHPSYNPAGARTGRFSAHDPNTTNIPRPDTMPKYPAKLMGSGEPHPGLVKTKDSKGNEIWMVKSLRSVVVAPVGRKLVSVDLAQIENRIIAHESQDPTLISLFCDWECADCGAKGSTTQALHACPECGAPSGKRDRTKPEQPAIKGFCLGKDFHSATAHRLNLVEKYGFAEGRRRGKTAGHAFNYGMGPGTLARREGFSYKDAEQYLDGMDKSCPFVKSRLHVRVRKSVLEEGVVRMFDGHVRRFYAPQTLLKSGNFRENEWEGVIREAVNVLAQGGTAVIMKIAMLRIRDKIRADPKFTGKVWLLDQIHDELLYECDEEVAEDLLALVIHELENAVQLSVPVLAEGNVGRTWGEAH